jgi:hypothetical protein
LKKGTSQKKRKIIRNFTGADVDREVREREALLKEAGLRNSIGGREAAYDDLTNVELCRDVARKFARESAKKTGDAIGEVLDRYETIVIEFIRGRSGGALIHDDATDPMTLEKLVQFLYAATKAPAGYEVWPELGRMQERKALFRVLVPEYARDRNTLMKFLRAVFMRHRKIGGERSAWREKLCTHQLAADYGPKQIAIELERRGVVANTKTKQEFENLRAKVRQTLQVRKKARVTLCSRGAGGDKILNTLA